jgi:hypothetical protein
MSGLKPESKQYIITRVEYLDGQDTKFETDALESHVLSLTDKELETLKASIGEVEPLEENGNGCYVSYVVQPFEALTASEFNSKLQTRKEELERGLANKKAAKVKGKKQKTESRLEIAKQLYLSQRRNCENYERKSLN